MDEKKDKIKAITGAILFHLLLLIALMFMALTTPLPLPEEQGVEVNLGFTELGMGNEQDIVPPPVNNISPASHQQAQTPDEEEEIVEDPTSEEEKIVEKPAETPKKKVEKEIKKEIKPVKETVKENPISEKQVVTEPVKEKEPTVDPRLLYTGKKSGTGKGNEGNDQTPGDKGKENGDPNATGYDGTGGAGSGNGISFSLGNRKAHILPKPVYNSDDQGKVVVSIWVDKNGNVTRAEIMQKGTNVTDINLRNMARDAALKAKFTPDSEAAEVQKGTITYNFIKLN
jgi:TonB family protein